MNLRKKFIGCQGEKMKTAIGYVRVSTNRQDNERQIHEIEEYCRLHDISIREIVEDRESGASIQRAELKAALEKAIHKDYLIVQHSSRLTRLGSGDFKYIIHKLAHHGTCFVSVSQSYLDLGNSMIRNIVLEFTAEMDREEREELRRRIKSKYEAKKAHAEALGQKVRWGRRPIPDDKIKRILDLRDAGASYRLIARETGVSVGKITEVIRCSQSEACSRAWI